MKKIKDFGDKILGAKKMLYQKAEIEEMAPSELVSLIQRDKLFPSVNGKKQVEAGIMPEVAYWQQKSRLCIYKTPNKNTAECAADYAEIIGIVKEKILDCVTIDDTTKACVFFKRLYEQDSKARMVFSPKLFWRSANAFAYRVKTTGWPYVTRTTAATKRKKKYIPPQQKRVEIGRAHV